MTGIFRRRRYEHNRLLGDIPEGGGYINGQAIGAVSRMRFGLCRMGYNGCGCIAVYNALVYLGRRQRLCDIALRMERFRLLFGIFGFNPYRIGRILTQYGADFTEADQPGSSDAFIISYRTRRRFFSPAHTVFCVREEYGIRVFNRYNHSPQAVLCSSAEELCKGRKPLAVYIISINNNTKE